MAQDQLSSSSSSGNLSLRLPSADIGMGSDAGDDEDQVEKKPGAFEEDEAYDAFVTNTG